MARIHLLSARAVANDNQLYGDPCERLKWAAARDHFGVHTVVADPADADIILFVERTWFSEVRRHPVLAKYRDRCMLFNGIDAAVPFLPGIFPALERQHSDPSRTRAGPYLRNIGRRSLPVDDGIGTATGERPFLYSFVGGLSTHDVRYEIAALSEPDALVIDTSQSKHIVKRDERAVDPYWHFFVTQTRRSDFVLCPRGMAVSSLRVFEAMQLGRAPVIIADGWVDPPGVDWQSFAITVAEADVLRLPQLLRARRHEAVERGALARAAWEARYAPDVIFHWVVETLLDIRRQPAPNRAATAARLARQLTERRHVDRFARRALRRMLPRQIVRALSAAGP
ncbi:MAG: hypothetical protein ACI9MR_002327 [Myxococcota bacterium]